MVTKNTDNTLDSLLEDNLGLVVLIARSFKPKDYHEMENYIQCGRIGIWKAYKKHNPSRSKLSTTMWHYIRYEILRDIYKTKKHNEQIKFTPLTEDVAKEFTYNDIYEYIPNCLTKEERTVIEAKVVGDTLNEIADKMGVSKSWVSKIYKRAIEKIQKYNE